jgi:hypothetical protein
VDVREQPDVMREMGIRRYPTLTHDDVVLTGLFLTRGRIRRFLNRL